MAKIVDFLSKGFEIVEELTDDEISNLVQKIKDFQTNMFSKENKAGQAEILAESAYFYYVLGKKISQVNAVKNKLEIQRDSMLLESAKITTLKLENHFGNKKTFTKSEYVMLARMEEDYLAVEKKIDKCKELLQYLEHTKTYLYMVHYTIRPNSNMSESFHNINR